MSLCDSITTLTFKLAVLLLQSNTPPQNPTAASRRRPRGQPRAASPSDSSLPGAARKINVIGSYLYRFLAACACLALTRSAALAALMLALRSLNAREHLGRFCAAFASAAQSRVRPAARSRATRSHSSGGGCGGGGLVTAHRRLSPFSPNFSVSSVMLRFAPFFHAGASIGGRRARQRHFIFHLSSLIILTSETARSPDGRGRILPRRLRRGRGVRGRNSRRHHRGTPAGPPCRARCTR